MLVPWRRLVSDHCKASGLLKQPAKNMFCFVFLAFLFYNMYIVLVLIKCYSWFLGSGFVEKDGLRWIFRGVHGHLSKIFSGVEVSF